MKTPPTKESYTEELFNAHVKQNTRAFVQIRVWRVIDPNANHVQLKYQLALVASGVPILRIDHTNHPERPFTEVLAEFWQQVDEYNQQHP